MKADPASSEGRSWFGAGAVAIGACAVCCAGPLLALLGAIGVGSLIGALWVPALLVLAALAGAGVWLLRARRARACARTPVPVDLGMPTLSGRAEHPTTPLEKS